MPLGWASLTGYPQDIRESSPGYVLESLALQLFVDRLENPGIARKLDRLLVAGKLQAFPELGIGRELQGVLEPPALLVFRLGGAAPFSMIFRTAASFWAAAGALLGRAVSAMVMPVPS